MSQELPDDHITKKTAVLRIPGMEDVTVRREVEYQTSDAGSLTMDIYSPPDLRTGEDRPAVISVAGYPDPGMARIFGRRYKEWGSSTSWARLIAASGMLAITYDNREPATDVLALLAYLRANGTRHGVDAKRLGLLAVSGHSPLALSVLMERNARPSSAHWCSTSTGSPRSPTRRRRSVSQTRRLERPWTPSRGTRRSSSPVRERTRPPGSTKPWIASWRRPSAATSN